MFKRKANLTQIIILTAILVFNLVCVIGEGAAAPADPPSSSSRIVPLSTNLLKNGDMDDPRYRFYWRPTNHYVAGMWFEWWVGDNVPEYIDGGIPYHNICYPHPPRGYCYDYGLDYFNLSQGYIRWGGPFIAGIYQVVENVTPCMMYEFQAYNRNDEDNYHPKVGIDPTGWQLPIPDWANPPNNCPPDRHSKCPDPKLKSLDDFPPTMVWSEEFDHKAYSWAAGSVATEALSSTITVWTYAAPEGTSPSLSTYWDATSLIQIPYPDGRLPEPTTWTPSGFVQDVKVKWVLDELIITWTTPEPASTQVWYEVRPYSQQNAVDGEEDVLAYPTEHVTELDTTPVTEHRAVIKGLRTGDTVRYVAMSRRPRDSQCISEVSPVQAYQLPKPTDRLPPDDWKASGFLQNVTAVTLDKLYISWETPEPASTQVWYNIEPAPPPPTSTFTIVVIHRAYLPLMVAPASFETTYEHATPLNITPKTQHSAVIDNIKTGDVVKFVALSCHAVNEDCVTEVSVAQQEGIVIPAFITKNYLPLVTRK